MNAPDLERFPSDLSAGGSPTARLDCGSAHAFRNADVCPAATAAAIAKLAHRPPAGLTLYKYGSRSVVGAYTLAPGDRVVLKYYYPRSPVKHLTYGMRGSRCMQSWLAGIAFHAIGVPTPAPLVIAEWHRCGGMWLSKSFMAARPAEGVALDAFIRSHGADHPLLGKAVESLRRSFSLMAAHRAVHGDLKANNLLLSDTGEVSFIDLDAALFLVPETRWKSLHAKDRMRFHANWKNKPDVAALFRDVFDPP
jgi:tRNA A-37 threonylcarbamoyl transferase component Bud32